VAPLVADEPMGGRSKRVSKPRREAKRRQYEGTVAARDAADDFAE